MSSSGVTFSALAISIVLGGGHVDAHDIGEHREFKNTSYAQRYELLCERLVRERLYDTTCFLMSSRTSGMGGDYSEPNEEFGFKTFATSLTAHAMSYAKMRSS